MKKLKSTLACFLTLLILIQSCEFYHEPKMTLKKAAEKQVNSTVFFKDSVKTYDYIVKKNDKYYGWNYTYAGLYKTKPILNSEPLIKDKIIAIRGKKQKDRTLSTISTVVVSSILLAALIFNPIESLKTLFFGDDDDDDW